MKTISSKSFQIIPQIINNGENIKIGRWTRTEKTDSGSGPIVKKIIKDMSNHYMVEHWVDRVKYAKSVTDNLRLNKTDAYFVPKTFISNGNVYEQFAYGTPVYDLKNPSNKIKKSATNSLANFINDMSEIKHTEHYVKQDDGIWRYADLPESVRIDFGIEKYIETYNLNQITDETKKIVDEINRHFNLNQELVFWHGDLEHENFFVDEKTGLVSIFDFEMAKLYSKYDIMYDRLDFIHYDEDDAHNMFRAKSLFDMADSLPRKTNPDFKWNYSKDGLELYEFIEDIKFCLDECFAESFSNYEEYYDRRTFIDSLNETAKRMKEVFENYKKIEEYKQARVGRIKALPGFKTK